MKEQTFTDAEILRVLSEGTATERDKILRYLYEKRDWKGKGLRFATKIGGRLQDMEDVVIEAFQKFDEKVKNGKFEEASSLETYFLGIVRNKALNFFNRSKRYEMLPENIKQIGKSTEEEYIRTEIYEQTFQALKALGEECQKVLRLIYDQYAYQEIAELTGLKNTQMVRKKIYRCRMRLRALIKATPSLRNDFDFFNLKKA